MKRIQKIVAAAVAGALIVGLGIYSIVLSDQKNNLKNQLAAFYSKSFEELMTDMSSLQTKLCKLQAASGSNQYTLLLMDVWRQAGDTQSSISALPVSYITTSPLTQFMNRTGDYCRSLSKKFALGEDISKEDISQIQALAKSCEEVCDNLDEMWRQGYPSDSGFSEDVFMAQEDQAKGTLDFSNQEYPRLQYDGPFSESTEDKKPEGLGGKEVSRQQAKKAAAEFLGTDINTIADDNDLNGDIACYGFSGENQEFSIYITKQGGQVLWYMRKTEIGISAVPTDAKYKALTKTAQDYLKDKGYGNTESSYAQFYGGMAVINLAPLDGEVILYPDLIKVWVDIAKGEVAGIDTNNYLMSHKQRELKKPEITELQAKKNVNSDVKIENVRLALIPLETGAEKLCYEFTGKLNENDYIIYINAQTGIEEDILMIQHTNEGTLVM